MRLHLGLQRIYLYWQWGRWPWGFLPAGVIFESFLFQFKPADQRNGDGEAKCPACRARVCPTVLHPSEPGS